MALTRLPTEKVPPRFVPRFKQIHIFNHSRSDIHFKIRRPSIRCSCPFWTRDVSSPSHSALHTPLDKGMWPPTCSGMLYVHKDVSKQRYLARRLCNNNRPARGSQTQSLGVTKNIKLPKMCFPKNDLILKRQSSKANKWFSETPQNCRWRPMPEVVR